MSSVIRLKFEKKFRKGCAYCGTMEMLTIDHKHPRKMGGTDVKTNIQVLCSNCNRFKAGIPHKHLRNIFVWYERDIRDKTKFGVGLLKRLKNKNL